MATLPTPASFPAGAAVPTVAGVPSAGAAAPNSQIGDMVQQSYGRCCVAKTFFDDFYDAFVKSSPRIGPMFAKTDFKKQKQLLRQSITYMIMFFNGSVMADKVVAGLGDSHSRSRLNVAPELYAFWLESLLATVRKHDPRVTPEIESAWRTVLGKGVAKMRAAY